MRKRLKGGPGTTRPLPNRIRQNRHPAHPKGILGWGDRFRRLLWSWWFWGAAAGLAAAGDHSRWCVALLAVAAFVYIAQPSEHSPVYGLDHDFSIGSDQFLTTIAGATGTPFSPNSSLQIYNNGDEFYPAMIDAIHGAKNSISIEAYIYWAGHVGRLFANALAEKARAGIAVRILLDAVGSSTIGKEIIDTLQSSGCVVRWYRPVHWYTINRINHRTHRKSLIIDGHVGFTGGAGIADHWMGNAENAEHWRDIQVRIQGPAVMQLQTGFAQNWLKTTGELLTGSDYYPKYHKEGSLKVQTIVSSPETGSSTVRIMYYLSIVCAREVIWIANPYFIPDQAAIDILQEAKRRGVDVRIMVAGIHNDNRLARLNSVRLYGDLLKSGIKILEYNHTMLHQKYMVCDHLWCTVGTTNFDSRSLSLNDENSVCIYDAAIAARFEQIFTQDLQFCKEIKIKTWRRRGLGLRAVETMVSLLKDQA